MNKENILKLADKIAKLRHEHTNSNPDGIKKSFNMMWLMFDCGTPACIAGWATAESLAVKIIPRDAHIERIAADWLGLDYEWAYENLFYPIEHLKEISQGLNYDDVTPRQAAEVLRKLATLDKEPGTLKMEGIWAEAMRGTVEG